MTTVYEMNASAQYLADNGIGADHDGYFGSQCVDLINYLLYKHYGIELAGNAIDLLDSAASKGLEVVYDAPGLMPKAGAFFVMECYGHPYGHTGYVYKDSDGYTMSTIEQNVDGNADYLENGGPARYCTRNFNESWGKVIGWFYPNYDESVQNTQEVSSEAVEGKLKDEDGTMVVTVSAVNVRTAPSTSAEVVAVYDNGEEFHYDSVYSAEGYIWVSYIGQSGERRYVAAGVANSSGNANVEPYGTFY